MNKLEKIEREAKKAREKIATLQTILKQIDNKRTEQENLQIIQQVRALKLSRDELYAFLNSGELPASLIGALSADTEPEIVYSRRKKVRNNKPPAAPDNTEPEDGNITNLESEGMKDENQ